MITNAILGTIGHVAAWIIGLFPSWSLPGWVSSTATTISGWLANVGSLGYFIPLGPIATVAALILGAVTIGFTIRILRIGYSMVTGGGGAA